MDSGCKTANAGKSQLKKKVMAMLPELSEIPVKRRRLGLTQAQLSEKAGVSQSLIAKIEGGKAMPSYDNAKRIFGFFEAASMQSLLKASDFMTSKVIFIGPDMTLKEAARCMKKASVSQLPVLEDGRNVGTISEKIVLDALNSAKDMKDVKEIKVSEVMAEAMPVVREDTPFKAVSALLELNSGVLVARKGKTAGIITKADLLNAVLEKGNETKA
ncbi:Zinc metalloprotease [uncultured archaeon]|nr:Zinc metalloprotease [uncultured archaeon]